jgi:hypothetical protein
MSAWTDRIRWGVIEDARERHRRERGVIAAAAVAAAVVAAIVLQSVGGGGSRPASASVAGRPGAQLAVLASCATSQTKELQGAPSQSLLSILGVLRRPATPADALPPAFQHNLLRGFTRAVYVNYIRRARVIGGVSYYIYPAVVGGCGQPTHEGIRDLATHVPLGHGIYGSVGGGGATTADIEDGRDLVTGPPGSSQSCTITMVVPDGVASVTLRFPAGPANGFRKNVISPAATVTTNPVGSLVAVKVPRSGGTIGQATMTWRAANGHVIKTFSRL